MAENPLQANSLAITTTVKPIFNSGGHHLCDFIQCMSTKCVQCGVEIHDTDGAFFVLTFPYCGVVHRKCAPWFGFSGEWPHPNPAAYYFEKGKSYA